MKNQLVACALVLGAVLAHADEPSKWRFVGRIGMGFGSTPLEEGYYANDGSTWELSSGNGLKYALGADYRIAEKVTLQATIGKERSTVPANDADLKFSRTPIELMGFFDVSKDIRLGLGLRKSIDAKVQASGAGIGFPSVGKWDSSVGGVLEAQYIFASTTRLDGGPGQFGTNLRFVNETFTKGAVTKKADHFELGLFLNY
jgi:hypothetical protein